MKAPVKQTDSVGLEAVTLDRWVWRSMMAGLLTLAAGLVALGVHLYAPGL